MVAAQAVRLGLPRLAVRPAEQCANGFIIGVETLVSIVKQMKKLIFWHFYRDIAKIIASVGKLAQRRVSAIRMPKEMNVMPTIRSSQLWSRLFPDTAPAALPANNAKVASVRKPAMA